MLVCLLRCVLILDHLLHEYLSDIECLGRYNVNTMVSLYGKKSWSLNSTGEDGGYSGVDQSEKNWWYWGTGVIGSVFFVVAAVLEGPYSLPVHPVSPSVSCIARLLASALFRVTSHIASISCIAWLPALALF